MRVDLTGLVRVDVLGQALAETVKAVQGDRDCRARARLVTRAVEPWIVIEPDYGQLWVHLESGHLNVLLSVDIREPAETAA